MMVTTADGEIIADRVDFEVAHLVVKAPLFANTIRAALEQINLYFDEDDDDVDRLKYAIELLTGVIGDSDAPSKESATWEQLSEETQQALAFLPFDFVVMTPRGKLCAAFEFECDACDWSNTVSDTSHETWIWQRVRVNANLTEWHCLTKETNISDDDKQPSDLKEHEDFAKDGDLDNISGDEIL